MGESVIDLFAGMGGWDVAARSLGLDPLGIELDDAACATRVAAGLPTVQADGLIASPPCQAFSVAGLGAGRRALKAYVRFIERMAAGERVEPTELGAACGDMRAHLVLEPLRWALALRPRWIACEQVPPVLVLWETMARALRTVSYQTWTGVLSSECFGVPQTRRRAILLAGLDGPVTGPPPTHARYVAPRGRDDVMPGLFGLPAPERITLPEDRRLLPWVSMADALAWPAGETLRTGTNSMSTSRDSAGRVPYEREIRAPAPTLDGKVGRSWKRAPEGGHREPPHRWKMRANSQGNATTRGVDEPAPTITGGHDHERRVWTDERPATTVNGDPRISEPGRHDPTVSGSQQANAIRVTEAEALILQGFAPDYPVQGGLRKRFEQIGNAIPPALASAALGAVLKARERVAA